MMFWHQGLKQTAAGILGMLGVCVHTTSDKMLLHC